MGTILSFGTSTCSRREAHHPGEGDCEIIIFPGVRIERHEIDLSHRLRDLADAGDFDGIGGTPRPRKTS